MIESPIPFSRACVAGNELRYVEEAARSGRLSGDGPFTARCHALLQEVVGVRKALLTTSCTHALEMTALLLDIQPGDEVIIPSFTFVSTANAFVLRGARPVFADVRLDTLNLDEAGVSALITPRTRAIVAVHYAGVACEMDVLTALADEHGLALVEDNAHGLFGHYKGRALGTFGVLATQSFHDTKNITCGEGGALLVNAPALEERAEILREKGTNRSRFFKGLVDKYTWVDVGSSYLPSELLAAFLLAQLEARERIQQQRQRVWTFYASALADWAGRAGVKLPTVPPHCEHPAHIFYMLLPTGDHRDRLMAYLKSRGIASTFHYLPLHQSEMGQRWAAAPARCPVTEDVSARLLRLPIHGELSDAELARIVGGVTSAPL